MDPDPYLVLMDPALDPGGPKKYGSSGSGFAILFPSVQKQIIITINDITFSFMSIFNIFIFNFAKKNINIFTITIFISIGTQV